MSSVEGSGAMRRGLYAYSLLTGVNRKGDIMIPSAQGSVASIVENLLKLSEALKSRTFYIQNHRFPHPHAVATEGHLLFPSDGIINAGLIIGPRGNTQKRMERETDCKIAIRGKGSVKEGARRGPKAIDEDDELHVYISGETEENVEKVRMSHDQASAETSSSNVCLII